MRGSVAVERDRVRAREAQQKQERDGERSSASPGDPEPSRASQRVGRSPRHRARRSDGGGRD
eukprot:7489508-Lingulodinium_polyedra.AAC.1